MLFYLITMPRKKRNQIDPEVAMIAKDRKREKELTGLLPIPSDQVPNYIAPETALKYEQFSDLRLEAVADLRVIIEDNKAILKAVDEADIRTRTVVLKELRMAVKDFADTLDNACKFYYDPKEQGMDTELNITIGYEAKP